MGRSVPRLSPTQRFAIYELKRAEKSGREISELCAAGYKDLPPFAVSQSRANEVAREVMDERGELYDSELIKRPPHEITATLATRLIHIADRESERLDRAQRGGKLNAGQLGQLAGALARLHDLLDRVRPGEAPGPEPSPDDPDGEAVKKDGSSWIADAVTDDDAPPPTPPAPPAPVHAALGDVTLGANGGSHARHDRRPSSAPGPASPPPAASP